MRCWCKGVYLSKYVDIEYERIVRQNDEEKEL